MRTKIVVVGGGEHARVIINVIHKSDAYEIIGYTDVVDKGLLLNVKYLGTDEVLKDIVKSYPGCKAVLGVGSVKVSTLRCKLFQMLKDLGFELPNIYSTSAIISEGVEVGEGSIVLDSAIINIGSKIGKCSLVYSNAIIEHDCSVGDFVTFHTGSILAAGSSIGDNSILSVGAIIVSHKSVCSDCLIGAGSIVISDVLKSGTYFGIPCRKIDF